MWRIKTPTRHIGKFPINPSPGLSRDAFTDGNPQTGLPSTQLEADWFDMVQEEIANVIELSGFALLPPVADGGSYRQLYNVIRGGAFPEAPADGAVYGRRGSDRTWQIAFPEAPTDGRVYGRQNQTWVEVTTDGGGPPGGPFLPLTGGTLYRQNASDLLEIRVDAAFHARTLYAVGITVDTAQVAWGVGSNPSGEFGIWSHWDPVGGQLVGLEQFRIDSAGVHHTRGSVRIGSTTIGAPAPSDLDVSQDCRITRNFQVSGIALLRQTDVNSGASDPLVIRAPVTNHARIVFSGPAGRNWATGTDNSGTWAVWTDVEQPDPVGIPWLAIHGASGLVQTQGSLQVGAPPVREGDLDVSQDCRIGRNFNAGGWVEGLNGRINNRLRVVEAIDFGGGGIGAPNPPTGYYVDCSNGNARFAFLEATGNAVISGAITVGASATLDTFLTVGTDATVTGYCRVGDFASSGNAVVDGWIAIGPVPNAVRLTNLLTGYLGFSAGGWFTGGANIPLALFGTGPDNAAIYFQMGAWESNPTAQGWTAGQLAGGAFGIYIKPNGHGGPNVYRFRFETNGDLNVQGAVNPGVPSLDILHRLEAEAPSVIRYTDDGHAQLDLRGLSLELLDKITALAARVEALEGAIGGGGMGPQGRA